MGKGKVILDFTDFGNREWKDKLHGGKADDDTPNDYDPYDIAIGTAIEREHSNNPDIATEISMDHDHENDTYYDELIMSGIADEKEAIDIFNRVKTIDDKKSAIDKIQRHLNKEKRKLNIEEEEDDYDEDDDEFDYDDFNDEDEDELGTDKYDFKDNELIIDDDEPKNKKSVMENKIKNYKFFLKEAKEQPVSEPNQDMEVPPERKYSKENKYKFQIQFDQKTVDKLNEYNFTFYVPEGEKESGTKPNKDTHNIIIDILNLTYSVVDKEYPDIRQIDMNRLKSLLENL